MQVSLLGDASKCRKHKQSREFMGHDPYETLKLRLNIKHISCVLISVGKNIREFKLKLAKN